LSPVALDMTVSLDGFVTAPNDGRGRGLGDDGEVLHYWVFGGPWTYDRRTNREATGVDKQVLADAMQTGEASVVGRRMYDVTGGWDGSSPFGPCIVVTHRVEERPDPASGFEFVSGVEAAIDRAREIAGDRYVVIGGGPASRSRPCRRAWSMSCTCTSHRSSSAPAARSSVSWGCGSISSAVASASRPTRRTSTFASSGDHAADMMIRR